MSVADKLQLKPEHSVVVLAAPEGVDLGIADHQCSGAADTADAVLLFVHGSADLRGKDATALAEAARRDAIAWVAYPKAGQLGTDLNRDSLASLVSARGVRPVRQVAIDDTWSALRFRPDP